MIKLLAKSCGGILANKGQRKYKEHDSIPGMIDEVTNFYTCYVNGTLRNVQFFAVGNDLLRRYAEFIGSVWKLDG